MTAQQEQTDKLLADKLNGLYVITDENLINENHFEYAIKSALHGGARIIQYRDKSTNHHKRFRQAKIVRQLCEQNQALCIINDDIELANIVNAHGVHLGRNDDSVFHAKKILGNNAIIGVSCYNDLSLARKAEADAADYVAFGAIFSSPTKKKAKVAGLEILSAAKTEVSLPICAIGGITQDNIKQVLHLGADMAAVISSVFSTEDISQATKNLSRQFSSSQQSIID